MRNIVKKAIIAVIMASMILFASPTLIDASEVVGMTESEFLMQAEALMNRLDELSARLHELFNEIAELEYELERRNGVPEGFVSIGMFRVSHYCLCIICCEIWSYQHPRNQWQGFVQRTASGTIPTVGRTIATDRREIAFGTEVFFDGNIFIAEDVGGAIVGNRIDRLVYSHTIALQMGIQYHEVFVRVE